MYLSDRDLLQAIQIGALIVDPKPERLGPTSIDLHLDTIDQARVWDLDALTEHNEVRLNLS